MSSQLKTRPAINQIQLTHGTITQDDVQKAKAFNEFLLVYILTKQAPAHLPSMHTDQVVDPVVGLPVISTELVCSKLTAINHLVLMVGLSGL